MAKNLATLAIAAAISGSVVPSTVTAAPVNLLTNGSFETGLVGWTHSGTFSTPTGSNTPAVAIQYNSTAAYPYSAYGEPVPSPDDATASPDAGGMMGAYFVDDGAINEGLSQFVFLMPGVYRVGFDVYAPSNGYANRYDARFSAQIAGMPLANYMVSSNPATTWLNFSGLATVSTAGMYSASFLFNTPGLGVAKDVVVDRVFIVATQADGSPIPEPKTLALFGIAAIGMMFASKQRARRSSLRTASPARAVAQ